MLIATLLAVQGPYYLAFTPGEVLKYSETFDVTETVGARKLSAQVTREQTVIVKRWDRNRATLEIKYSEPRARGTSANSANFAGEVRSWVDRADGEAFVDQRGIMSREGFPSGSRSFFGFNVPGHRDKLPSEWKTKLLPPMGMDKAIEFVYSQANANGRIGVAFRGAAKDKDVQIECDGTTWFESGKISSARMRGKVTDSDGIVEFDYSATRN
ncbi:MAG: hypothetical protein ABL962_18570 [Fimbriimonadaceae bacterium]